MAAGNSGGAMSNKSSVGLKTGKMGIFGYLIFRGRFHPPVSLSLDAHVGPTPDDGRSGLLVTNYYLPHV
jgi:hypothetical protein